MSSELELWQFVSARLDLGENVGLLVVAESSGSSPGRAGYKMAVALDGELSGSIGGGVMEVNLVEQSRALLSEPGAIVTGHLFEQVHRKDVQNSSGMICSGRQTVISRTLTQSDLVTVEAMIDSLQQKTPAAFEISNTGFQIIENTRDGSPYYFARSTDTGFLYQENLGFDHHLFIIGGGHCALALSELMSRLDFRICVFDDRPGLNTTAKNAFATEIRIIENYENIRDLVPDSMDAYVVVMTLGYAFDEIVIRKLIDKQFKYFGVLGSRAKMKTLLRSLENEGIPAGKLSQIRTPIGLQINSHTPEEIAVSIAAEIILVKNSAD